MADKRRKEKIAQTYLEKQPRSQQQSWRKRQISEVHNTKIDECVLGQRNRRQRKRHVTTQRTRLLQRAVVYSTKDSNLVDVLKNKGWSISIQHHLTYSGCLLDNSWRIHEADGEGTNSIMQPGLINLNGDQRFDIKPLILEFPWPKYI